MGEMDGIVELGYSWKRIISILDRYMDTANGEFGQGQSQEPNYKVNRDIYRAPFEDSIISKVDIDTAIDSLGPPGRWLTWCEQIDQHPRHYGLTPKQYKIALYIRGGHNGVKGIAKELARIA